MILSTPYVYNTEIQNGIVKAEIIVLNTIDRVINFLSKLNLSAKANGVIASGMAISIKEAENCSGERLMNLAPK